MIELVGDQVIESLPVRYTAIAADIKNEKEIWINSGRLFDAIRASISLPLMFTPYLRNGVELIDGGVLNPVPIAPTFNDNNDVTIAVNLGGAVESHQAPMAHQSEPADDSLQLHEKVSSYIRNQLKRNTAKISEIDWGIYDIANQAFDAMQGTIARQKLAAYPPDITIDIARNACATLEFDRADEMIALGYSKAQECYEAYHQKSGR
jgi:NTE family protein